MGTQRSRPTKANHEAAAALGSRDPFAVSAVSAAPKLVVVMARRSLSSGSGATPHALMNWSATQGSILTGGGQLEVRMRGECASGCEHPHTHTCRGMEMWSLCEECRALPRCVLHLGLAVDVCTWVGTLAGALPGAALPLQRGGAAALPQVQGDDSIAGQQRRPSNPSTNDTRISPLEKYVFLAWF